MALSARDGNNLVATLASDIVAGEHVVLHADRNLGTITDSPAASDFGGFSLIALIKRLLSVKLPDAVAGRIPVDSKFGTYGNLTLTVSSTLATGLVWDISKFRRIRIQVHNTGANPFDGFQVQSRSHASGDFQTHLSTAANYTAPAATSILRQCGDLSGAAIDLTTLPAGGKAVFSLNFRDIFAHELRIRASSAAGTSLQLFWGAD